jgi:hypothetical protein
MKVYKSKIDWWLILIFLLVFGYPIVEGIIEKEYVLSIVFGLLLLVFFILAKTLRYKMNEQYLIIWWKKIEIATIRKVYFTRNPLSSPALSLDRIAIVYNKYDEILISPEDKEAFISDLLKLNPNIETNTQ